MPEASLTICIPTYNRAARVKALVNYILPLVEEHGGRVEILVSNNVSTDGTGDALRDVRSPCFRLHNRDTHLPTAEQNIFASIELCRGEYVWVLGDDDIPTPDAVAMALQAIDQRGSDLLYFNSQFADDFGGITDGWFARIHGEFVEMDFASGACAIGLMSNMPGISNIIFRRAQVVATDYQQFVDISLIYSHMAWWLLAFKDGTLGIVNRVLVRFRVDDSSRQLAHLTNFASKSEVGDFYFWGLGFMRLCALLERHGALSARQISAVWEFRRDGTTYRLLDNLQHMIWRQVRAGVESMEPRNQLTGEELLEATDWLMRMDPSYFEGVQLIRQLGDAAELPSEEEREERIEQVDHDFALVTNHKIDTSNRHHGLIGGFKGYSLFRHSRGFVALDRRSRQDPQQILRWVDPMPAPPEVFFSHTIEDLQRQVDEALSDSSLATVPDAVRQYVDDLQRRLESLTGAVLSMKTPVEPASHV